MKTLVGVATLVAVTVAAGAPRPAEWFDVEARRAVVAPWLAGQPESRVNASMTRAAVVVETTAGPVVLWTAPTRDRGRCYLVDIQALPVESGGALCSARPARESYGVRPWHTETLVGERMLELFGARVAGDVASVEVRFADGRRERLRPSNGFVLRELSRGEEPVAVVARDRRGAVLDERQMPGLRSFRRELPFPIGGYRTVIELGTGAALAVAPGTNGTVCVRTRYRGAQRWSCGSGPGRLAPRAVNVHRTARLLTGEVGSGIRRLEVWFENGGAERISVVEGYVLHELPRGRTPKLLVGLGASGAVVARQRL